MTRAQLIKEIALKILRINKNHPTKVCIDGVTASGKTTFANELAQCLKNENRDIHRASLDGFHNPKKIRYQKGRSSPEGYYFDAYNYSAIVENLLAPLSKGENFKYRTQVLNLETDQQEYSPKISIDKNGILIVDGSFSLRHELYDYWDFSIYLSVDMETAQHRAGDRDQSLFGSKELAMETTKMRYHAAHLIHNECEKPWKKASVVVDNNGPLGSFIS